MAASLSERAIQRANMQLIIALGFQAAHVPNGMNLSGDRIARAKQMAVLKKDGLRPGFPDLVVIGAFNSPGQGTAGFIEVKEEGETKLDPDQLWWAKEIMRRGLPWALVNTPDGAKAALREWGWIR